jgi:hypothetical protein
MRRLAVPSIGDIEIAQRGRIDGFLSSRTVPHLGMNMEIDPLFADKFPYAGQSRWGHSARGPTVGILLITGPRFAIQALPQRPQDNTLDGKLSSDGFARGHKRRGPLPTPLVQSARSLATAGARCTAVI